MLLFLHQCLSFNDAIFPLLSWRGKKLNLIFQAHSKCIWLYTCPTLTLSLEWYSLDRFAFNVNIFTNSSLLKILFLSWTYLQRKEKEETNEKYNSNRNDIKGLNDKILISSTSSPSQTWVKKINNY